jgi:DNA-binding transcriptional regulator YiaG
MMTSDDLQKAITDLGTSTSEFAALLGVTSRAVQRWLLGEREIPGPVEAFVRLFKACPETMRAGQLARIRNKEAMMFDGLWLIKFTGAAGFGSGVLVFNRGKVFGADEGGASYDGDYRIGEEIGTMVVDAKITVPANVTLVQGPTRPYDTAFNVRATLPLFGEATSTIETPDGPVSVAFKWLRDLPREAA